MAHTLSMVRHTPRRVLAVLAIAVLATTALLTTSAGTAHAASGQTVRIATNITSSFDFLGVADASSSPGTRIVQWPLSGSEQVWTLVPVGGHFEIVNQNSGQCIFADGILGDWLYQEPCDGSAPELWNTGLTAGSPYAYSIQSVYNTSLYMDIAGASANPGAVLDQWYWNGGLNQYFTALAA
jgi:Ricin-type beta-trefoil lectin domain-like